MRNTLINRRKELKDPRELIRVFISRIESNVDAALKSGVLDESQKTTIQDYLRNAREHYAEVEKTIDSWELDYDLNTLESFHLLINLACLLFEIHEIGSHTTISEPVKKAIRMEQAKLARLGRAKSSRETPLISAIKAEVKARAATDEMAVSEKFAGMIRPGVLSRLDIKEEKREKQWPSVGTIKLRLAELKKGVKHFKS